MLYLFKLESYTAKSALVVFSPHLQNKGKLLGYLVICSAKCLIDITERSSAPLHVASASILISLSRQGLI